MHPAAAPLLAGILALLEGDTKTALKELQQAALSAPESETTRAALGTAALALGEESRARDVLASIPSAALYYAMGQSDGPGGNTRAQNTLIEHAKLPDDKVSPGALFLAALAFANAKQPDRADEILSRAIKLSPSAFDEGFAPDPTYGAVRFALSALESFSAEPAQILQIAGKLAESGRLYEARAIATKYLGDPLNKAAARGVIIKATEKRDPRRALEQIELLLAENKEDRSAAVKKIELHLALNDYPAAKRGLENVGAAEGADRAALARARAKIALHDKQPAVAVEAAEDAAAAAPGSNEALALLARALLAAGKIERAFAFANQLQARKPTDVDPYEVLAAIAETKGEKEKARTMRLRSDGFRQSRERIERERSRREAVIAAVRDAEAGLGIAGLESVRSENPLVSLPIDLATAKAGTTGFKRAARDRILAACRGRFANLLKNRRGYQRIPVMISPYGKVISIEVQLSAADPARCTEIPQRAR